MPGQNGLWLLAGFLLALAILGGGGFLWQRQQRQRRGAMQHFETLLSSYYHKMAATITDRQALVRLLTQELPQILGIQQAKLLFLEGQELVAGAELRLPVNNAAVRQVVASGQAARVASELQTLVAQGRLDLSWTAVWVPLMRGTTLYGLWLLGRRTDTQMYTDEQLQWYTTLARQAALILSTVQIAEQEQEKARQLQALYQQAVSSSESERSRLARELHDGVLQELCALARDLKAFDPNTAVDPAQVATLTRYTDESVHALRAICHNLRPPFLSHNLPLALQVLVERFNTQSTVPISLKTTVETLVLPEETTIALYRIAQEALTNAIRHADASEILVRLTQYPQALRLTISDDGRGLPSHAQSADYVALGHYGLVGMRERAKMIGATLELHSAPDYGTAVIVQAPL